MGMQGWVLLISETKIACLGVLRPAEIVTPVVETEWVLRFYLKHLREVH